MQIVIDIPEEMWERVKEGYVPLGISKHLKNGTPLPKGHGRLIDADELPLNDIDNANYGSNYIRIAPTIIEADKAESEGEKDV